MNGPETLAFAFLAALLCLWFLHLVQDWMQAPLMSDEELSRQRIREELASIYDQRPHHVISTADSEWAKHRKEG